MAANSSVYSANTLQGYSTSEDVTLALLPLNLADYGGAMSSLFYLDDVRTLKDKFNKEVFVGLVATNSYNYGMRPASRLGKGRFLKDGVTYVMCNDGGLNTYGFASATAPTSAPCNRVKVNVYGKSAYYSASTRCGVYYSFYSNQLGQTVDGEWLLATSIPSNEIKQGDILIQDHYAWEGDTMTITPFIINGEGEKVFSDASVNVILTGGAFSFKARPISSLSDKPTNDWQDVYITPEGWAELGILNRNELGQRLTGVMYSDADMTTLISAGYWQIEYNSYNATQDITKPTYEDGDLALYTGDKAVINVTSNGTADNFLVGSWSDIDYTRYGAWSLVNPQVVSTALTCSIQVDTAPSDIVYIYYTVKLTEALSGTIGQYTSTATAYDPNASIQLTPIVNVTPEQLGLAGGTFDSVIGMNYTFDINLYVSTSSDLSNPQLMSSQRAYYTS